MVSEERQYRKDKKGVLVVGNAGGGVYKCGLILFEMGLVSE